MEDRLDEASIPEIWETEEEQRKSFKDLRTIYTQHAKDRFQGRKYRNKALDEDILVSRDGIDKLEGILSFREQCIAIQLIDQFLTIVR